MLMSRVLQSIYSGKVLITNPDRFFAELSGRDASLKTPFAIVLVSAIAPAIANMICYSSIAVPPRTIVGLIAPFIGWFLCVGAFYAISILFRGVGSFKRVLEFTGYGFIPQIPSAILNAILLPILLPLLSSHSQFMMYAIACYMGIRSQACTQSIDAGFAFHGGWWRGCRVVAAVGSGIHHSRPNKLIEK
jgi:hypothetical protein